MKIRIRHCRFTKTLDVDDSCSLNDLYQSALELFDNNLPREYFFSLNGTDPLGCVKEGFVDRLNDVTLKSCNIVGGDLLHIVSLDPVEESHRQFSNEIDSSTVTNGYDNAMETTQLDFNESLHMPDETTPSTSGASESAPIEEEKLDFAVINKYLREPMLCRDCCQGTVPPLLAKVYQEYQITTPHEALIIALHILMLESGYTPVCKTSDSTQSTYLMNEEWKSPGSYKLRYTHNSCAEIDIFTVVCVNMNRLLIVHGLSPDKEDKKCHLNLVCSDYIHSIKCDICDVYRNLPKLSMLFKDAICAPLVQTYRQNHGYESLDGIMSLSHEIKLILLSFLDVSSTVKISHVCKDLQQLSRDRYLWRRHYLRDFGHRQNNDLTQDWYNLYRIEYKLRKQRERERRKALGHVTCIVPPVFRPYPGPDFPSPFNPLPPGMIGGDFDLFPQFQGPNSRRGGNPLQPLQPRFDPLGPVPDLNFRPGRGGGMRDNRGMFGKMGGPRFF